MPIELYITETETVYPENRSGVEIHLWGRDREGNEKRVIVEEFEPYFYIKEEEDDKLEPKDHDALRRFDKAEIPSLFGDELTKVIATHPGGVPDLKEQYDETFEADVVFTNRLRIDEEIFTGVRAESKRVTTGELEPLDIEDAPVRYLFFDIEVDDRQSMPVQGGEVIHTESKIVSICAYDSFEEEYHGFISLGQRQPSEAIPEIAETGEAPGCLDKLHYYYDEKLLVKEFFNWVSDVNPDLLLAWNGNGFDIPYLIERGERLGLDAAQMARGPDPDAFYSERSGPNIDGRVCYDLMNAWEKMQYTEVSSKLENAAQMELGEDEGKLKHEDSIHEMWKDDASRLLKYNAKDVELMVDINDEAGVMQDREELKDIVGVDYQQTIEANDFIEMLARRMLHEVGAAGPTKTPPEGGSDDDDYDGAYTFPAFEGRRHNVVSIDLASLYPFTMWMLNSSPEQLIEVVDNPDEVTPVDPDRGISVAPNGAKFDRSEDGLFRKLVDKAMELTRQAARRRDQHDPDTEEWAYWNEIRESRKRIRNGLYGVLGWVWFFLYDEPTAESVTTMAQRVIKRSAEYINEETDGEVIYGDTDSCYISWPNEWTIEECLEHTSEVVETLNNEVYPELATEWGMPADECKWEIEIEDASETMFQAGKKKRYAKKTVWKEGMDFDELIDDPSVKIVGFEYKRSDCPNLLEELQEKVLTDIVEGVDDSTIRERVFEAAKEIDRTDPDYDRIGIPGGIGKELDNYDSDTAQVRAAKAGNELLGLSIGKGDKPKRVYIEEKTLTNGDRSVRTDVIGFEDGRQLDPIEGQLYVDVARMRETVIERPMGRILDPIGIDVDAAMKGQQQNTISDLV